MLERFNIWAISLIGRIEELKNEDGQAMVEYALILALVSVVAIIVLTAIGTNVTTVFGQVRDALAGA